MGTIWDSTNHDHAYNAMPEARRMLAECERLFLEEFDQAFGPLLRRNQNGHYIDAEAAAEVFFSMANFSKEIPLGWDAGLVGLPFRSLASGGREALRETLQHYRGSTGFTLARNDPEWLDKALRVFELAMIEVMPELPYPDIGPDSWAVLDGWIKALRPRPVASASDEKPAEGTSNDSAADESDSEPLFLGLRVDRNAGTVKRDGSNYRHATVNFETDSDEWRVFLTMFDAGSDGSNKTKVAAVMDAESSQIKHVVSRVNGKLKPVDIRKVPRQRIPA